MPTTGAPRGKLVMAGISFAFLWASASAATKVGLSAVQPLVLFIPRFFLAGAILLLLSHVGMGKQLPKGREWLQLAVYGLFNISLYLGIYVIGMQETSAGLGALATATNPVFISLLSAIWLRKPLRPVTVLSLVLCLCGIVVAAWPLIGDSYATPWGVEPGAAQHGRLFHRRYLLFGEQPRQPAAHFYDQRLANAFRRHFPAARYGRVVRGAAERF